MLLAGGGAAIAKDYADLESRIRALCADRETAMQMGNAARRLVASQKGATAKNVRAVEKVLAM